MRTKPKNPYNELHRRFSEWVNKAICRTRITMWHYPKSKLNETWTLGSLYERVAAAEQIGFEVHLTATEEGLHVTYVAKVPSRPWDL